MKFYKILILLFLVIFSFQALALTADEYYGRAAKKYVMEDLEGAEADLLKALQLNSTHQKARDLLNVVRKELGKARPAAPPPTVAPSTTVPPTRKPAAPAVKPAPAPRPTLPSKFQRARGLLGAGKRHFNRGEYLVAEKYFLEVLRLLPGHSEATRYLRETRKKIKTPAKKPAEARPKILPPPAAPKVAGMEETLNQLLLLLLAVALVAVYVLMRWIYFAVNSAVAKGRMQVCPECKTKNMEAAEFCQFCGTRLRAWAVVSGAHKKWFSKFGWKRNPFTLDIIPSLFTGYSSQVDSVMEKLSTRSGHILVYGEKGVGKTTFLRWLADNLKRDNHAIYVVRPPLSIDDLIRLIVSELKGDQEARRKKYSLYEIEELVKKARKPVVILLDEAHEIPSEVEQNMRSLGDIEGINYVLAGLPETKEKIKKDSPPFFDRMVLETYIDHLSLQETRDLIKKRIENVGGEDVRPFTGGAIENVFKMSRGRPRMIIKVCDWVLTGAIRANLDVIGEEAGKDFPAHEEIEKKSDEKEGGQP